MEHSDDSKLEEELKAQGLSLQIQLKEFLDKLERHSRKRKPEATEDAEQKKPRETQDEIKLELTRQSFDDDTKKVLGALETRDANREVLVFQLWEFWKNCWKRDIARPIHFAFEYETEKTASLLLGLLRRREAVAAVFAMCALVMVDGKRRKPFVKGGLADLLVEIINSDPGRTDIAESGLQAAFQLARGHDGLAKLVQLGIVSVLEKCMESHPGIHDIIWPACCTCYELVTQDRRWPGLNVCYVLDGDEMKKAVFQSNLPKLLRRARDTFPAGSMSFVWASQVVCRLDWAREFPQKQLDKPSE